MIFSEDFYKEETRNGYTVTTDKKKTWAVQLNLLEYVMNTCESLQLRLYAWGGTLLGAVRDNGFIPWDDNIDLAMPRADFEVLSDYLHEKNSDGSDYVYEYIKYPEFAYTCKFYGKLADKNTTCVFNSCNYNSVNGISLYIHPLDFYNEENPNIPYILYESRNTYTRRALSSFYRDNLAANSKKRISTESELASIREFYLNRIDSLSKTQSDRYIVYHMWSPKKDIKYSVSDFEDVEYMDFENTKVPVPAGYHNICVSHFGNSYMMPVENTDPTSNRIMHIDNEVPWSSYKSTNELNMYDDDAPLPIDIELPDSFFEPFVAKCNCHPDYLVTKYKRRVHAVILDLLVKIDTVCKENNIKYFIDGGTLLGAVRDQGIIYWDDDADIVLFREDYEKLVKAINKLLKTDKSWSRYDLLIGGGGSFRNLTNRMTTFVGENSSHRHLRGISVDIFPMDKVPADKEERMKFYSDIKEYREYFSDEIYKKYNCDDSPYYATIGTSGPKKEYLKTAQYYQDSVRLPLNGFEFDAPARYEECCLEQYGENWRKHIQGLSTHKTVDVNPCVPAKDYMFIMPDFSKTTYNIE